MEVRGYERMSMRKKRMNIRKKKILEDPASQDAHAFFPILKRAGVFLE